MRYPAFIAEMGLEANRPRLWVGIWSGYSLAIAFELLAIAGQLLDVVPWTWTFHVLVGIKLLTNTLAYLSLRLHRGELEAHGLNILADIVVMTGAVYYTGGQASPMFAIYVIEIAVIALLTNRGITLLVAAGVLAAFGTMSVAIHLGLLTQYPSPVENRPFPTHVVVLGLVYQTFVLLTPTFFTTSILRLLRRREEQLEQRTRELIEAGTQKSQLMANVTHELRTPIHGILSLSELCETGVYGPMSEAQREAHGGIRHSAETLLRLVDDLLLQAKSEAGKLEYEPSDIVLDELFDSVVASVGWMLATKSLELERAVDAELFSVRTDRGKLNQVLVNLLANAAKFTPEGGRIVLGARRIGDDQVALWVQDTGIGIPEDELDLVFDEFRQLDGGDERRFGGIGLGLALAKRLVEMCGGRIEVESAMGQGSNFTVVLPLAGKPAARAAE